MVTERYAHMEIENVHVSGFKAIDELEFEPGQITLVTGPNNSGKTSLLEAIRLGINPRAIGEHGEYPAKLIRTGETEASIHLMKRGTGGLKVVLSVPDEERCVNEVVAHLQQTVATPKRLATLIPRFEEDSESLSASELARAFNQSIQSSFSDHREEAVRIAKQRVVKIESTKGDFVHVTTNGIGSAMSDELKQTIQSGMSADLGIDLTEIDIGRLIDGPLNVTVSKSEISPKITVELLREANAAAGVQTDRSNGSAVRLSEIRDLLNRSRDGDQIDSLSFDQIVFDGEDGKYQIPYNFTGDGFQRMVELLWRLFDTEELPDVLLLEEPETHMHPEYVRQLVRQLTDFVRREDIQLFTTTHDIDLIRSFFDAVPPEQQEFLKENFRLLQMDPELPEIYDYEEAREVAMEMHIDLRGR